MKIDIDDAMLLVVLKRRPDPVLDKDAVIMIAPANAQDAMRISAVLTQAQKALIEMTKQAVIDGAKKAEKLR